MKKIKIYLLCIISVFMAGKTLAQVANEPDSLSEESPRLNTSKTTTPFFVPQKLHLSVDLGTGFIGSKLGSGTYFSVAPNLSYLVTPKLKINLGAVLVSGYNSFSHQMLLTEPGSNANSNVTSQQTNQAFVYASGQYLLNDKITVTGSAYKTVNSDKMKQINPYFLDYKGMNLGIDYKLTKNVTVGAQVHVTNSNNPYLNYYGNGSGLFTPYGNTFGW